MVYAPILIPTLCRYEHFVRCIESLKKNTWACYTDVYVAVDYPSKPSHFDGYNKICEYLEGDFSEFASFNVIKRTENYGSVRNMNEMRDKIVQKYDRFIRTDDDIEFAPVFLEYMDKCLEHYKDDENVVAVSGYSYPIDWQVSQDSTVFLENFVVPMWGTGFWTDKFLKVKKQIIEEGVLVEKFSKLKKYKDVMTDACFLDYVNDFLSIKSVWLTSFSDISMRIYCAVMEKSVASPVVSKSRNLGFDGSGMYCQAIDPNLNGTSSRTYLYAKQPIDMSNSFDIRLDSDKAVENNKNLLNEFDKRDPRALRKTRLKLCIYRALGRKLYLKLLTKRG